jgi:hypothetical protein
MREWWFSKYFYEPREIETANGLYVTHAAEKRRLEEKQRELYMAGE